MPFPIWIDRYHSIQFGAGDNPILAFSEEGCSRVRVTLLLDEPSKRLAGGKWAEIGVPIEVIFLLDFFKGVDNQIGQGGRQSLVDHLE